MLAIVGFPPSSLMNSPYMSVGSVRRPSPRTMGVPKSAIVAMNTRSAPAVSDGRITGRMTRKKAWRGRDPRLSAASSIDWSTAVSAPETSRKTSGKYWTTNASRIPR